MRRDLLALGILAASTLVTPAPARAATYQVDAEHTSVTFQVRHLFTQVQGRFDRFEGTIEFDPQNPKAAKVAGSIDVASVNTNVEERDKDLRSSRFFHAEKHPKITFESTGVAEVDSAGTSGKMKGNLSIHGVTRPVLLDVSYIGAGKDPWGNERAGFTASTTINRKDFGLTWNEVLESGGLLVGEEVRIEISAEGMLQEN